MKLKKILLVLYLKGFAQTETVVNDYWTQHQLQNGLENLK